MKGIYSNILVGCLIGIMLLPRRPAPKHLPEGEIL